MKIKKNLWLGILFAVIFFAGTYVTVILGQSLKNIPRYESLWEKSNHIESAMSAEEKVAHIVVDYYEINDYKELRKLSEEYNFEYELISIKNGNVLVRNHYMEDRPLAYSFLIHQRLDYKVKVNLKDVYGYKLFGIALFRVKLYKRVIGLIISCIIALASAALFIVTAINVLKITVLFMIIASSECLIIKALCEKASLDKPYGEMTLLLVLNLLLYAITLFYMFQFKRLQKKVKIIDSDDRLNIKTFPISMQEFAEDVNKAAESINEAVLEQRKSDRLKTELISNVSHDLKTPLTSIINFSDLIYDECTDNEQVKDYAKRLYKQSVRLKGLMDSLIEASKASAGAVEIMMVPCNVGVILEQCSVEYEERLLANKIELIEIPLKEDVMIMGDVKALSRIFDNLFANICKYALSDSRAYVETKVNDEWVSIIFKNISRDKINVSTDELTERFVRGDASRHSEGYGLGLSIVKSLMDLMNGKVEISAEYDVFEVKLSFNRIKASEI